MKKIHRVLALLMAVVMALGLITTAFAEPIIDTSKKASLSIYKYDITTASSDGAWDAESYVSTGLHDDAVIDKLSKYAIQGVEFTYLRVADIAMNNELVESQRQVGVLYGFDGADAVLSAIGVTAADAHKSENGKNYYTSDLLNNKLSAVLTANATAAKNALEAAVKNGTTMTETDAAGHTSASDMEQGLYLVVETRVPENVTSTCNPFFVSLPMTTIDGAAWNYDVTVYPKNQTGNPTLDKTVREAKNSTGKNTGSLTDIQNQAVIHLRPVTTKGGTSVPPLVVVQQFAAIGAGLCRQVDMTDFIQRREINAFHICFDLVIAERVTRLRNQADKCVLAVVKDNELMVAGVNRHCLAMRGGIRPFMVFMGIIQRNAVDAHAALHPAVYGNGAEAFFLAAGAPVIPVGEGAVVPYPIVGDALPGRAFQRQKAIAADDLAKARISGAFV